MYTCPYCGGRALSPSRKMFLGPARSVKCQSCQRKFSVSWWAMAPAVFAIVVISYSLIVLPYQWSIPIAVLAFAVYSLVHLRHVPLVGRDG